MWCCAWGKAEAHPCDFKWVIEAKNENKATLIVVGPVRGSVRTHVAI
jgi:hypothetical protein